MSPSRADAGGRSTLRAGLPIDAALPGERGWVANPAQPTDFAVAESFVVGKYRRLGIGIVAAQAVFLWWAGHWEAATMRSNSAAHALWSEASQTTPDTANVVVHDRNDADRTGSVYRFVGQPDHNAAFPPALHWSS